MSINVLMHICCGPCSLFPIDDLRQLNHTVTGLFYNPNIHPFDEHERRIKGASFAAVSKKVELIVCDDFDQESWELFDESQGDRCSMCYSSRLEFTAKYAAEHGYSHFTSSLLVSPYQKHELISQIARDEGAKYNVSFLYRDFRPGFRAGQNQARELSIYRQKYCGCIKSKN